MKRAEITVLRMLARQYYKNKPVLPPLELAARLWKHDRPAPEDVSTRTLIEKVESMCEHEWKRAQA